MIDKSWWVLSLILALGVAAGGVMVVDSLGPNHSREKTEEFQRLVGGLGFGPAVDLSQCAFNFDPRLGPDCPHNQGPLPGGAWFCPHHGCSILYYPSLHIVEDPEP